MADDLASRISDGAVAVLELVPGEQRFIDLSNYVLRGGASRFAPVVLDDEHLRYVLPVGIPAAKLDYGTLLIQKTRCALVWRSEPGRPYHALIMELSPETTIAQSPVTVRGEVWGRFDLTRPGGPDMTFLVPPVASPALPRMLHRVLIEEPGSKQGRVEAAPLSREVIEGPAEPQPSVAQVAPGAQSAPGAQVAPGAQNAPVTQEAPATTQGGATAVLPAVVPESPAPDDRDTQTLPKAASDVTTAPTAASPVAPAWAPRRPESESAGVPNVDRGLYRDATRTSPATRTAVIPAAQLGTATAVAPARVADVVPDVRQPRITDPVKGFLAGFVATVVVGGLIVAAKLMGWLG